MLRGVGSWLFALAVAVLYGSVHGSIVNVNVARTLRFHGAVVESEVELTVKNAGQEAVSEIEIGTSPFESQFVRDVFVCDAKDCPNGIFPRLGNVMGSTNTHGGLKFQFTLPSPLENGAVLTLFAYVNSVGEVVPSPSEVKQTEKHNYRWTANSRWYSPYATLRQTSKMITDKHGALAELGGVSTEVPPYTEVLESKWFEYNEAVVVCEHYEKTITVSHWGSINVHEKFILKHEGPRLKGAWSRVDFPVQVDNIVRGLQVRLPLTASNMYYRDSTGNITTSKVQRASSKGKPILLLAVEFRFPLVGGWRNEFWISYDIPPTEFLSEASDGSSSFRLDVPLYPNARSKRLPIRKFDLRIVFPEGASGISYDLPDVPPIEDAGFYKESGTLTLQGTPVVHLHSHGMIWNQDSLQTRTFPVYYTYSNLNLLIAPARITLLLAALFFAMIAYVRISDALELSPDESFAKDPTLASSISKIKSIESRLNTAADSVASLVSDYKIPEQTKFVESKLSELDLEFRGHLDGLAALASAAAGCGQDSFAAFARQAVKHFENVQTLLRTKVSVQRALVESQTSAGASKREASATQEKLSAARAELTALLAQLE